MESHIKNGFFNIGTGRTISILQLAEIMINISGMDLNPEFASLLQGDVKLSQADTILSKKSQTVTKVRYAAKS